MEDHLYNSGENSPPLHSSCLADSVYPKVLARVCMCVLVFCPARLTKWHAVKISLVLPRVHLVGSSFCTQGMLNTVFFMQDKGSILHVSNNTLQACLEMCYVRKLWSCRSVGGEWWVKVEEGADGGEG